MREPVEPLLRGGEFLAPEADVVVRGWPLTVEGILRNADDARSRFTLAGTPFVAVSAEACVGGVTLEDLLAGPRLRTRRRYAAVLAERLLSAGFELLPSFTAPHYSIVLPAYSEAEATRLSEVLGEARVNPYFVGRRR